MKDTPKMEHHKAMQRALKNRAKKSSVPNPGSYPKSDYRYGMPRAMMNLKKLREKNKIITSLD